MKNIYFIAEIGVNHEAKLNNAYKHILLAKKGGAQAIKLQSYKAEKIVSKYALSKVKRKNVFIYLCPVKSQKRFTECHRI